jgi:DNA-binding MarR family transcriptional regulator
MHSVETEPGVDVVRLLLRCHRLQKDLAFSAGLSVDEFHCLSQLYIHAPCFVKTLCEYTGFPPTRASRLLNALERRGFLHRQMGVEDRRTELLTLTQEGIGAARCLLQKCVLSAWRMEGLLPAGEPSTSAEDSGAPM